MLSDLVNLTVPVYVILAIVFGYFAVSLLSNWRTRASFFLTLLVISVVTHSWVGLILSGIPSVVSVIFFEIERHKNQSGTAYMEARKERFKSFPVEKWDGATPLVLFDTDIFLLGNKVFDYVASIEDRKSLQICKCGPVYLQEVEDCVVLDGVSYGAVLPVEVKASLDALNLAIRKADAVSWEQASVAIDVPDLYERSLQWQRRRENSSHLSNVSPVRCLDVPQEFEPADARAAVGGKR